MRFVLAVVTLCAAAFVGSACSQYDPYRETQTKRHKQTTHEIVKRALEDKLTRIEYESAMQSFDTSIIEERSKEGEGLEELKEELDADSENKVEELFGGDE